VCSHCGRRASGPNHESAIVWSALIASSSSFPTMTRLWLANEWTLPNVTVSIRARLSVEVADIGLIEAIVLWDIGDEVVVALVTALIVHVLKASVAAKFVVVYVAAIATRIARRSSLFAFYPVLSSVVTYIVIECIVARIWS
jgi:hypothetical protein